MAAPRTHYAILNVAPDAEPVVIDAAYRALMKKYHPDQGAPGADAGPRAAEINAAFAVLRDPQRRAEYDHREWTRSQAIQLAQYQQSLPPPRRSNFFGWGGWLVALVLAGAIGVIAGRDGGGAPPVVRVEPAKAAALPEPELGSQPSLPPVPPAELAQIRSDAMLGPKGEAAESAPPPPPAPLPAPEPRPVRTHLAFRHRAAPSHAPDKDFVERHGGIY